MKDGKKFCLSDWLECLVGVMVCFGLGVSGLNVCFKYLLYVCLMMFGDLKCVIFDLWLCDIELMVFDFVLNFVKDNNFVVIEVCELLDYNVKK